MFNNLIFIIMSDTKIFSFPEGGSCSNGNLLGILAPMLQQRGLDPNLLLAMNNGNGFGNGEGAWFIWILFLFMFMGWGNNGWGNNGNGRNGFNAGNADLAGLIVSENSKDLLMQAIQGNATAISQLASTLNCDINSVNSGIQNLQTQLCNIGNSVGMTGQQIINAIQSGNATIASQLCDCCCTLRSDIANFKGDVALQMCQQTNTLQNAINFTNSSVERGFAAEAYERQAQTCTLQNAIEAQSRMITDKFAQLEQRELVRENQNLRDQLAQCRLSDSQAAQTAAIINQLQPVAKPAYLTVSPYQSVGYPFGYNNVLTYNGGCGCNNSCGCGY